MSKGGMKDLLKASLEDFDIMVKSLPSSEKPEVLRFFKERYNALENL